MLGSPILYLKAMRILMFQLSGFYCRLCSRKGLRALGCLGLSCRGIGLWRLSEDSWVLAIPSTDLITNVSK